MRLHLPVTPQQKIIIESKARRKILNAGRRWGKTALAKFYLLSAAAAGHRACYIAPSYAMAREVFDAFLADVALRPVVDRSRLQPYPSIFIGEKGRIDFRSFDRPDSLRGFGYDLIILDEAACVSESDFETVLVPTLTDRSGTLLLISTPRGSENWFSRWFQRGIQKKPGYASWHFTTMQGPAFIGNPQRLAELEDIKRTMPDLQFRQEYLAEFVANISAVFRLSDIATCTKGQVQTQPVAGRRYVVAWDIGRVQDAAGWLVMDSTGAVADAGQLDHIPYELQARHLQTLCRRFNASAILDSTGGGTGGHTAPDAVIGVFRSAVQGLREYTWNTKTKQRLVDAACVDLEQHKISIPGSLSELLRQLGAYEYTQSKSGVFTYGAPQGLHDDQVAAFLMANTARRMNWLGGSGSGTAADAMFS